MKDCLMQYELTQCINKVLLLLCTLTSLSFRLGNITPFASTFDKRFPFDIGPRLFAKKIEPNLELRLSLFVLPFPWVGGWMEPSLRVCGIAHCK